MKELEERDTRQNGENWYKERTRLKDIIDEKNQQIEKLKKDEETHRDHIDNIRREASPKFLLIQMGNGLLNLQRCQIE